MAGVLLSHSSPRIESVNSLKIPIVRLRCSLSSRSRDNGIELTGRLFVLAQTRCRIGGRAGSDTQALPEDSPEVRVRWFEAGPFVKLLGIDHGLPTVATVTMQMIRTDAATAPARSRTDRHSAPHLLEVRHG